MPPPVGILGCGGTDRFPMKVWIKSLVVLLLAVACGVTAYAAVTFDATTGQGFVGKGDVQYTLGWNNADMQKNYASVMFQASTTVVTEVSWVCTNDKNENIQERARTTTATVEGVVSSVARDNKKNQITGFNLTGYDGIPASSSSTDGPALNSCPSGPWSLTTSAGDPETVSSSIMLEVSGDGGANWTELLSPG
jgi:hypothetical protein